MANPPSAAAGNGSAVLEVTNLWKVFGAKPERAIELAKTGAGRGEILSRTGCAVGVRDVNFSVAKGETFVVMGLSGSGKSTLIRCAARLVDPTMGHVFLDGDDLLAMDDEQLRDVRRHKMSMVFQHFGLFPHRRVIDNVAYGLEVQGMKKGERYARAQEVIKVVGLEGWETHYPQQLSGGMQQRVGLARALALDPELLFFDEPFSALDPLIRRDMQDELLRLKAKLRCTIVFITHDFAEALKLGDHIAIMKDGVFDQIGTPTEIISHPATDYVKEFTKDIPRTKVLTAAAVAQSVVGTQENGRSVGTATRIEDLVPMLLESPEPISVVDEHGEVIGVIDRSTVAALLESGR